MATASNEVVGNALARTEAPTDSEIEAIRKKGASVVSHNREVNRFIQMLSGTEWGAAASPITRATVAEFCKVVGAHPVYHVDILGGVPYLNSRYWSDRINSDPRFIDFTQTNISKDAEAREHYGVPEWATYAYETVIKKLLPFAPIELIRSGEIKDWQNYVSETREASWAGGRGRDHGKPDPVGDAFPSQTARTRSMRRCGARAFAAWMANYEEQITKAERALEAEWEEIKPGRALPQPTRALTTGRGEPQASIAEGQQLPVEDLAGEPAGTDIPQPTPQPPNGTAPTGGWDETDARKAFFAVARKIYGTTWDRAAWQAEHGLPESTKDFGEAGYAKAMAILEPLVAEKERLTQSAYEGSAVLGFSDVSALCSAWSIGLPFDRPLEGLRALVDLINAKIDGEDAGSGQRTML